MSELNKDPRTARFYEKNSVLSLHMHMASGHVFRLGGMASYAAL